MLVENTTPYPWPWRGQVQPENTALILVSPGRATGAQSAPPRYVESRAVPLRALAESLAPVASQVALTVDVRADLSEREPAGPPLLPEAVCLVSDGWSAFYGSGLEAVLRQHGITDLLLAGAYLEVGVHSTMRDANDRGYECLLLRDACVSANPTLEPAAISSIEMSGGIFGAVGTTHAASLAFTRAAPVTLP